LIAALVVLAGLGLVAFWLVTVPRTISASELPVRTPDLANGELMFWAGGCESCHAAPGAGPDDLTRLGGGQVLATPFGGFHVPNISPDRTYGIGNWTLAEFVTAMKLGVGPGGVHLYPAFPYPSYQRMRVEDIIDLKAFLDTLPPVATASQAHDLKFPFSIRRGVGLWQLLNVDGKTFIPDPAASAVVNRGAYLVQGPAHCGECHTPRGFTGAVIADLALTGAPMLDGTHDVAPNLTPHPGGLGDWSEAAIVRALQVGLKPGFDAVGGAMGAVVGNLARLPRSDAQAIAAYLKSLPPRPTTVVRAAPAAGSGA
jgi:mono/diheme cytochrome c family protein